MMKTLLFLLVAVLAIAFVSCRRPWPKRCKSDADCKTDQCCVKMKFFSRCMSKLSEGNMCGFPGKIGKLVQPFLKCGCKEDLVCKKGRLPFKQCTDVDGSGDNDFLDY